MEAVPIRLLIDVGNVLMFLRQPSMLFEGQHEATMLDLSLLDAPMPPESVSDAQHKLKMIRDLCSAWGCGLTISQIDRTLRALQSSTLTFRHLDQECIAIQSRFADELEAKVFLLIDNGHVRYYSNFADDWVQAMNHFPSINNDVEEVAKCFALNRYTASVFHSMRVLEVGLTALGQQFGVSTDRSNWQNIIDQIESSINRISVDREPTWREDEQYYSEVALEFRYYKNAWRNHAVHGRDTYDEERARRIMVHVRDTMNTLAVKLHE